MRNPNRRDLLGQKKDPTKAPGDHTPAAGKRLPGGPVYDEQGRPLNRAARRELKRKAKKGNR